jgi:hypothetical protein
MRPSNARHWQRARREVLEDASSGGQNGLASSVNLLLPDAMATGKLEMVSNAIVREITTDKKTGLANGAQFVDRHSRQERHVKARAVVLAAGTLESTRLMLNSGIANSSGVLGHYLHDQIYGISVVSSVPEARDGKRPEGLMGGSSFVPRFRNLKKAEKRDFIKGYCVLIQAPTPARRVRRNAAKVDHYAGSCVSGSIFGGRHASKTMCGSTRTCPTPGVFRRCTSVKDGENEHNMAEGRLNTIGSCYAAGYFKTPNYPPDTAFTEWARRGWATIRTSVLNKYCQATTSRICSWWTARAL